MRTIMTRVPRCVAQTLLAAGLLGLVVGPGILEPRAEADPAPKHVAFDVAGNAKRFVFQGPVDGNNLPAYGASFVIEGVIYPPGTLDPSCQPDPQHAVFCGLKPDGTPEFPDRVIGTWTCSGWFIGNGATTSTGPYVITSQMYDFNPTRPGTQTMVSSGIELIDPIPFERAVTGGTGRFKNARGQIMQTTIGANASGEFNHQFVVSRRNQ